MIRRIAAAAIVLALALPLGAEETPPMPGMSGYRFGFLRKGPAWTAQRTPRTDSLQVGHMANINRMAAEGKLLAAGPLVDGGDLRGILIFPADSAIRPREEVARDPAVGAGRLVLDLFSWFAPSGIGEPYRAMAKQPGHRDSMVRLQLVLLKTGPRAAAGTDDERKALQVAHVGGILRALAAGELATAGPFSDGGDLRGILVYRGDSAFAHRRALEDPAVKAGHLVVELHPWFVGYGTMPGDTLRRR
jgi:uncharacterized protein YciI